MKGPEQMAEGSGPGISAGNLAGGAGKVLTGPGAFGAAAMGGEKRTIRGSGA